MIINALSKEYIKTIDIIKVLKNNGFTIFKSLQEVTNAKSLKLQNNIKGKLLEGKIDISVDRGYQTHPEMSQQDSALSTVKNENIFLNIIADGAGCSAYGEIASALFVSELKKWFEIIPDELLNDIDIMTELLKQKIILSSDGITDLVSEERFKSYFINDISSSQMIEDALSKKYTKWLSKDEDNISVIVIKLPDYTQKKLIK